MLKKSKRVGPCWHCGSSSSTQWRVGPPTSPTLCNACGVCWGRKKKLPLLRGGAAGPVPTEREPAGPAHPSSPLRAVEAPPTTHAVRVGPPGGAEAEAEAALLLGLAGVPATPQAPNAIAERPDGVWAPQRWKPRPAELAAMARRSPPPPAAPSLLPPYAPQLFASFWPPAAPAVAHTGGSAFAMFASDYAKVAPGATLAGAQAAWMSLEPKMAQDYFTLASLRPSYTPLVLPPFSQ